MKYIFMKYLIPYKPIAMHVTNYHINSFKNANFCAHFFFLNSNCFNSFRFLFNSIANVRVTQSVFLSR